MKKVYGDSEQGLDKQLLKVNRYGLLEIQYFYNLFYYSAVLHKTNKQKACRASIARRNKQLMGLCYLRTALLLKDVTKLRPTMLITQKLFIIRKVLKSFLL